MTSTTDSTTRTDQQIEIYDRMVITDLVYRLGVCLDEGRFDDMRDLAIEGATVRTPGGESVGREAFVAQARRNHPADQGFHHVTTNVLIDLAGDEAKVRANLLVHITSVDDDAADAPAPPPRCSIGEVYHFDVVRTTDGWRFAHVEATPRWFRGTLPLRRPPAE
jgi:hypothetical protein